MESLQTIQSLGLKLGRRRAVAVAGEESLVKIGPLFPDKPIPYVIEPALDGVDLLAWLAENRAQTDALLAERRALLFRGFGPMTAADFERAVALTSTGGKLAYRDRSTPRAEVAGKIYTSTEYPADQRIFLHNEGTYWLRWPMKIYFCCLTAAQTGGETPIADCRRVYDRIDPAVRDRFAEKGWMLMRNYGDGFGLGWREVFQTEDKAEVEAYCRDNDIELEWKPGDRLRTRQTRPAVYAHPRTGERLWFNHAAFFHVTSLDAPMRQALTADFAEADLPYQTFYGDGSPIDGEVADHLRQAYRRELTLFPWRNGDIMLLDNMTIAHGRSSFTGPRKVVVAMTEPQGR